MSSRPWLSRGGGAPGQRRYKGGLVAYPQNKSHPHVVAGMELIHDVTDFKRRVTQKGPPWPQDTVRKDGTETLQPRKFSAHAALTLLRPETGSPSAVRVRWCVFFPLDDSQGPFDSSNVVHER
ncbi:MAG: hypothetical protein ACK56F_29155, partial [bacterium]